MQSRWVRAYVGALVAMLAGVLSLAAPQRVMAQPANTATGIGDPCLVGSWRDDTVTFLTKFHKRLVFMQGLTGALEVDGADGSSTTHYAGTGPAFGYFDGYRLKEIVRGRLTAELYGDVTTGTLRFSHKYPHHMTITYTWRGRKTVHAIVKRLPSETQNYTCDSDQYTVPAGTAYRLEAVASPSVRRARVVAARSASWSSGG